MNTFNKTQLRKDLLLYAVTDRSWLQGRKLESLVEEVLLGGATLVQLREKDCPADVYTQHALSVKKITDCFGVPLIINDCIQTAIDSGAAGLHIGKDDMKVEQARKLLGSDKILGVSVQTPQAAILAELEGADYLGAGAMFPTSTKETEVLSMELLREICSAVKIPVVAIGGITRNNLMLLCRSGISGIAVVSALFAKKDTRLAAKRLVLDVRKVVIL